jgi:type IV secretion system protein VirB1
MDLLKLAVLCGHLVHPAMTLRVIEVESQGQAFAIHDNTSDQSFVPHSLPEAVRLASILISAGHRVDLGLMQINYEVWLKPTRLSLAQAFDPCTNIFMGSTILSADYGQALQSTSDPNEALWRALSRYNTGTDWRGWRYAERLLTGRAASAQKDARKASTMQRAQHAPVGFSEYP